MNSMNIFAPLFDRERGAVKTGVSIPSCFAGTMIYDAYAIVLTTVFRHDNYITIPRISQQQ